MGYLGEDGIEHVTSSDRVSAWSYAHIACCPRCAVAWGAQVPSGVLPMAQSIAEARAMLDGGHEAVVIVATRREQRVLPVEGA